MLELLFSKVAGLQVFNFLKKRLEHRYFPANIPEFLRTSFFIEHLWWLLLQFLLFENMLMKSLVIIHLMGNLLKANCSSTVEISRFVKATLLKSHFGMRVLL